MAPIATVIRPWCYGYSTILLDNASLRVINKELYTISIPSIPQSTTTAFLLTIYQLCQPMLIYIASLSDSSNETLLPNQQKPLPFPHYLLLLRLVRFTWQHFLCLPSAVTSNRPPLPSCDGVLSLWWIVEVVTLITTWCQDYAGKQLVNRCKLELADS